MAMESASKFNIPVCPLYLQVVTNACIEESECWIVDSELTQRFLGFVSEGDEKRWALTLLELFLGGTWTGDAEWNEWWTPDEGRGSLRGTVFGYVSLPPHSVASPATLFGPKSCFSFSLTERQLGLPEARRPLFCCAINSVWLIWVRLPRETLKPHPFAHPPHTPFSWDFVPSSIALCAHSLWLPKTDG